MKRGACCMMKCQFVSDSRTSNVCFMMYKVQLGQSRFPVNVLLCCCHWLYNNVQLISLYFNALFIPSGLYHYIYRRCASIIPLATQQYLFIPGDRSNLDTTLYGRVLDAAFLVFFFFKSATFFRWFRCFSHHIQIKVNMLHAELAHLLAAAVI